MPESKPEKSLLGAIALNALVMPGSGHYVAGLHVHGIAMISASLLLIFVPFFRFMVSMIELTHRSTAGNGIPMRSLAILQTTWHAQRSFILACIVGIIAIWMFGIVDLARRRHNSA